MPADRRVSGASRSWPGRVRTVPGGSLNNDTTFARLVSLACHDLRTPLATVNGFARTLERTVELEAPADRYVEMIVAAVAQLDELLDELSLVARIEADRYDPNLQEVDTLALARAAADRLGEDRVKVEGEGAPVLVDSAAVERGVSALVQAALRHGGLDEVQVRVRGAVLEVEPVTDSSSKVVLGQDLRDLGAAVAVRLLERLGGAVEVDGSSLKIHLPQ
ncbi:MAG: HAMP domain-containing histidine kinase [Actinobacteria bacterium]|nr:MAG: HAMP domain-containing histidine kinase [Actinomycetota bacterium]